MWSHCGWYSWTLSASLWNEGRTDCVRVSPCADLGPSFLAEALLEQAMIGPSPNPLILSYLKYAISSQVRTCWCCWGVTLQPR